MRCHLACLPLVIACSREARPADSTAPSATERAAAAQAPRELPRLATTGRLETVATFWDAMPTGVTVSRGGRIFVSFPRWGDPVPFTVGELRNGQAIAYPSATLNHAPDDNPGAGFVSVQSVVVDSLDRLWAVDTGSIELGPVKPGGAKLVAIDLATNQIVKAIAFPPSVVLPTSYLNDIRFDLRRGAEGVAYLTDSSDKGSNAIIVVDLATGTSMRRLVNHPSVRPNSTFKPFVEGQLIAVRAPGQPPKPLAMGADGIAISGDGETLYFCPLASRRLYAVPTDALVDPNVDEGELARTVADLGEKGASDGLESDAEGRVYATQYEQQAIVRRSPDGTFETLAAAPYLLWPDTLSLGDDRYLYVIANQLHRQARFQGSDRRQKPYVLFRIPVDGTRIVDEVTARAPLRPPTDIPAR